MSAIFKVNNFKAIGDLEVSGNAGIGTTPYNSATLTVLAPAGYAYGTILASNATSPAESIVQFRDYNNLAVFEMRTNGQSYFIGNMGIGVNNIGAKVHIKGSTSDNTAYAFMVDNQNDPAFSIRNDRRIFLGDPIQFIGQSNIDANIANYIASATWCYGGFYLGNDIDPHTSNINNGVIRMGKNTSIDFYADYGGPGEYSYGGSINSNFSTGILSVRGGVGGTHLQCGFGSDGIFIDANGFISIGTQTTVSNQRVTIKGVTDTDLYNTLYVMNSTGGVGLVVRDDSNVGIGTSNPSARLHVKGSGIGYGELFKYVNFNGDAIFSSFDNGELYYNAGTAYQTVKHTSGRWDFPNTVTIGGSVSTGIERLMIKGLGDSTGTIALQIDSQNFTRFKFLDDGTLQLNRLQDVSGSTITLVGGATFTWASGGGITNANLIGCTVYNSDIIFANDYGLSGGIGYIKLGDTIALSQAGGGVTKYFRYAPLGGNFSASLDRFVHPSDGGFTFVAQYAPHAGRLTYVSNQDALQVFSNTGWIMPIGTASKNLGNVDDNTTASVTYTQAEVQEIADRLKETRQVLKSVLEHLGNNVKTITLDNTTDVVNLTSHGLLSRHRIKFISGTLPAELSLNTYYYLVDSTVTADTFQITSTYGGLAIDFSTNGSNIYMQIEYSGMNLFTD